MAKKYLELGKILKRLLFERDMTPAGLAREVNIPPPTIHRLITGKSTRPYQSSLMPIADFFSISLEQLIGEKPLSNAHENKIPIRTPNPSGVPLIPWEKLPLTELEGKNTFEILPFAGKIDDNTFATLIPDSSMEPIFERGSILIFNSTKPPKDRSYILVQLHEANLLVFRQLLIDLDHRYLKPLNPDLNAFKMRLLNKEDRIIGTLIESRQIY